MPAGRLRSGLGSTARTRKARATRSTRLSIVATRPAKRAVAEGHARGGDGLAGRDLAVEDLGHARTRPRPRLRSSSVVSTVSSSTRAPTSTWRSPTMPSNGARTVRSASRRRAPSRRARAPSRAASQIVDRGLRDGVVAAQLGGALVGEIRLAQRGARLRDLGLLDLVVEAHQHVADRDPLAGRELDARTTRPEVSGTMSTACLASVVPTASMRRRSVSARTGATSTGTACGPRCTAASAPADSGSSRRWSRAPPPRASSTTPAAAICLTSDTRAMPPCTANSCTKRLATPAARAVAGSSSCAPPCGGGAQRQLSRRGAA